MKKLLFFGGILALGVVLAANMGGEEAKNPCERLKQLEPVSEMPTRYEVQEAERRDIRPEDTDRVEIGSEGGATAIVSEEVSERTKRPIDVRAENIGFDSAKQMRECKREIIQ